MAGNAHRWCPEPQCYWALIKMPRRSFRHVVATGEFEVSYSENNDRQEELYYTLRHH